ncbi:general amidase, partial [Peniophora sp. CONT]
MATQNWQEIAEDKRKRLAALIPKDWLITPPPDDVLDVTSFPLECGLLSEKEIAITEEKDIGVLLAKLASAELSALEVTTAFAKRAMIAQQTVNCLTEIFIDKAFERAAYLDEQLKKTGKTVGPLHGLPISLKDQIRLTGLETSMGYVSWLGKFEEKDAVLAELLVAAGAIPYVRTNVPQTLMWVETYNAIFGRTLNPYNRKLTSGGSSGGEGALIGMKGSPLGVGSDIGGSIRVPAAFCGLYGLRPSYNRVPYHGSANSLEGQDSLPSVLGPLCPSLSGILAFMRAVVGQKPWLKDPVAVRKPWNEDEYALSEHGGRGGKLVFAFLWNDGVVVPHPPIARAMEETKRALIAAGHEVVDWEPTGHKELVQVTNEIWTAAGEEDYRAVTSLTGEPLLISMETLDAAERAFTEVPEHSISAFELFKIHKRRLALRKAYLDRWEATAKVSPTGRAYDAIIAPVAPWASAPHGKNNSAAYTSVWNALDYSACVFPVTQVDPAVDVKRAAHAFLSERDEKTYNFYEPETWRGAPVGLHLVGRSYEEEAVIAMTEVVAEALVAA